MRFIAIKRIAFTLGDRILDARGFHAFFSANWLDKIKQPIVACFHFIHIGRGPARRTDPHLALAIAIAIHQRRNIGAAKIGDIGYIIGFGERAGDAEPLIALIGVGRQRDRAGTINIFLCEAFLVGQPNIRMHVNIAFALIHTLENRGVVTRYIFNRTANTHFNDGAQKMGNRLRPCPRRHTDFYFFTSESRHTHRAEQ